MLKEAIGEAASVEEATELAVQQLGAPADADVKLDVIAMPKKKIMGLFGGSLAKVKASYDDGKASNTPAPAKKETKAQKSTKPTKTENPAPKKAEKAEYESKQEKKANESTQVKRTEPVSESVIKEATDYLSTILDGFMVEGAQISAKQEDDTLFFEIKCDDYGIIIGRRGETLDALQYLVSLIVNKSTDGYKRVTINVGDYREKREDTLRHVANKNANHVLRTGRRVVLEPMNPYERRIIHTTVQEIEGVTSRSVGSNGDRKVVIELADGYKPTRERNDKRRQPARQSTEIAKKLDKGDKPKFGKIE